MQEKDENSEWLFGGKDGEAGHWEAHRRFISEEFNPIYRQGVIGPHHLREAAFSSFLSTTRSDPHSAAEQLKVWIHTDRPKGGDFGDVAIERIAARASEFEVETALGITTVFAEIMDDYYRWRPKDEMFYDVWQQTEGILGTFNLSLPGFSLESIAGRIAREGKAVSWMACTIGRNELWSQGLAGDRKRESIHYQLSEVELRSFLSEIFRRILKMSTDEILNLPRLAGVLFTIKQSPWHSEIASSVMKRLAGPRTSDARFITFLEAMAGTVISSNRGAYRTLSLDSLHTLIGQPAFDRRWSRLENSELTPDLMTRLTKVKTMIAEARNW